jgi:ABC-type transporter Mla subunit MlaD
VIVFASLTVGAGGKSGAADYKIELDNAFGLVQGADLKVAGVRAGKIKDMKVDLKTKKALVSFTVTGGDYSALREDVFCESRPQSLIGEYFIDCQPGHGKELKKGSTIPVSRTASTIPADLVNNILRLPYRQRLRIIVSELGTAVAGRENDLNLALRRGVPALRETDNLLAILAEQNRVIADLTRDADTVVTALADNKGNVGRWVTTARNAAVASAERASDQAATFRKLPGFLEALRPNMVALGRVADEQTPALQDLNASAKQLTRFFNNLGPFADASRPSLRSLGDASVAGDQAVKAGRTSINLLKQFASGPGGPKPANCSPSALCTNNLPELSKNLAAILHDLDDRGRAVEKDATSPGGQGFTGLEALLRYVYTQQQSTNIFDQNSYILKVSLFGGECGPYRNGDTIRNPGPISAEPGAPTGTQLAHDCNAWLGPTQPGINAPDPTTFRGAAARTQATQRNAATAHSAPTASHPAAGHGTPTAPGAPQQGPAVDIQTTLGQLLGGHVPSVNVPKVAVPQLPHGTQLPRGQSTQDLLNYLLSP